MAQGEWGKGAGGEPDSNPYGGCPRGDSKYPGRFLNHRFQRTLRRHSPSARSRISSSAETDQDLQAVIAARAELPDPIRRAVLALNDSG